eukprot:g5102.t1
MIFTSLNPLNQQDQILTGKQMRKMGKAMRRRSLRSAIQRALLWKLMFMFFLCSSSANADCSNVANEVAQILPGSTVQCEGGRCNLLIEDAGLARGGNWDEALQYVSDCERRRLNSITPLTNGNIHQAVSAWLADETSARQTYGNISAWDTSEVTDMAKLFCADSACGNNNKSAAEKFNSDISKWDVSKVSTMVYMFNNARMFNSDVSKWDVSKVSTMYRMFGNAYQFNSDVSKWDVSKVSNMYGSKLPTSLYNFIDISCSHPDLYLLSAVFFNAKEFNSEISTWNVAKVSDMHKTKVSTMHAMFRFAYNFNSDLSKWNVGNVINLQVLFFQAYRYNFKSDLESSHVWSRNPHFNAGIFAGTCSKDRENGGTCGTCADVSARSGNQPAQCGTMREPKVGSPNCTFCADYGDECCLPFVAADDSIHEAVSSWLEDETRARQTYGDISVWDTSEVTDMSNLFCAHDECVNNKKSAAASFNGDLSKWNVAKVSTMFRMFMSAHKFNSDVSKWNVSKVSTMNRS